jgi:hypothetical protein
MIKRNHITVPCQIRKKIMYILDKADAAWATSKKKTEKKKGNKSGKEL